MTAQLARTERTWTEFTDQCNPLRQVMQRRWTLVDARPAGEPGMWEIAIGNTPLRATVPAADLYFLNLNPRSPR
jgi:hypothetical protein